MHQFGIRGKTKELIKSYLTKRKQYTVINNYISNELYINYGVPQGSILGPLLFNLYINDICDLQSCNKILYADDAILYVTDASFDVCIDKAKSIISALSLWLKNNKLIPNLEKTSLMYISPHSNKLPNLTFDGVEIKWVNHIKYLGIYLDNKLNFNVHIDYICNELSKFNGIFYSMSKVMPKKVLTTLFLSLALPKITQNIIIWGCLKESKKKKINILINKILRKILDVKYDKNHIPLMSTNNMYTKLHVMKFEDVYEFHLLKFIHYILYEDFSYYIKYFNHLVPNNRYETRNKKINLPTIKSELEKISTIYNCCKLWRVVDDKFLVPQSKYILKSNFIKITIQKYSTSP